MGHEIDLKDYEVHTDLAIELVKNTRENESFDNIKVTSIVLDEIEGREINKKPGTYITIEFEDVTDMDNFTKVKKVFVKELKKLLKDFNDNDLFLIIGLGNDKSTPDALGPLVIDNVLVTNHLAMYNSLEDGFKRVCAFSPGVTGETGIETSDLIKSLVTSLNPACVIVIDALASSSVARLNKTIQMSDAGINPGSGIGNKRKEISKDTLNVPVIALGVPTVVGAPAIVSDTINYMYQHFAYSKANIDNPVSKLKVGVNYLKEDVTINKDDKKHLLGIIGTLNDEDIKKLIYEVLNPIGYNLMVTPKEEDFIIDKLGTLIGEGINESLHEEIK